MAEKTEIAWTDSTFNPFWGCQKVGPGCDNCYAEDLDKRTGGKYWGPGAERRRTSEKNWNQPRRWNKQPFFECEECGRRGTRAQLEDAERTGQHGCFCHKYLKPARQRVFCASMADVFDNAIPVQWRFDLIKLISETPNLDWLLLTKRIGNAAEMLEQAVRAITVGREGWADNYFPHVWIGASICNQSEANRDIPKLLAVPSSKRFLSMEPLLGPVELNGHDYSLAPGLTEGKDWLTGRTSQYSDIFGGSASPWLEREDFDFPQDYQSPRIDLVIAGGESGCRARPMHPEWVRSLRDQCRAARVPFIFKQWGEWIPRSDFYHKFADGLSCADLDPGASKWPCIRLTQEGRNGRDLAHASDGDDAYMQRVGKKMAGRLLDGALHHEFPM